MALFRYEMRTNGRSWLIWALALGALVLLMMSIYPSFLQDSAHVEAMMESFPEAFSKAFGLDKLSIVDVLGFYAVEVYFMIILFGSLYAATLGAGILAKEEDEKTIEFLLALPHSRSSILVNKLLTVVVLLALLNLVVGLTTFISFAVFEVGQYSGAQLTKLVLAPFFIHAAFALIAFGMSLIFVRRKAAVSTAMGLVVGLYFVNVLATLSERFQALRYLSPFYYVEATTIMEHGLEPLKILVLLAVSVAAAAISFYHYGRRDIVV